MKPRIFLVAILLMLLVSCASAATKEGYIITSNNAIIKEFGYAHAFYQYEPFGYAIVYVSITPLSEGTTTEFTFTQNNGSTITGDLTLSPAGLMNSTGIQTVSLDGGTSTTNTYVRLPLLGWHFPAMYNMFFFRENATNDYYFVATKEQFDFNPSSEPWSFNTDEVAYVAITGNISSNPITSIYLINPSQGDFDVVSGTSSFSGFDESVGESSDACGLFDIGCHLKKITDFLKSIVDVALEIGAIIAIPLTILKAFGVYFFVTTFVGFNVLYFSLSVLLAIEDSDDIFRAFGSLVRRMMKLWRFYMEIFRWLKDIIKWW